jgi:hypothetical protein
MGHVIQNQNLCDTNIGDAIEVLNKRIFQECVRLIKNMQA